MTFCPPRFGTPRDPDSPTLGAACDKLNRAIWGTPLFAWQRHVADVALETVPRAAGGVAMKYQVVVVVVPRRAGKTRLTQAASLFRASAPGSFVWFTAQDGKTAAEKFRLEMVPTLKASQLAPLFKTRTSAGSERVTIQGGGVFKLFAPVPDQLHGFDGDMVCIDEAWSFTLQRGQEIEAAARPLGLTRGGAFQLWIVSAGGDSSSTWLDHWQTLGRSGAPGVAYFEWSADADADGYDPYDPALLAATHPSVAEGHVPVEAILQDAATMDRAIFERAYLNVWERPSEQSNYRLDPFKWSAGGAPNVTADANPVLAFGVDVAQDRQSAAIVAAGRNGSRVDVEVISHEPGTNWVVPALRRLHARRPGIPFVMDALACAGVVAELRRERLPVETTGPTDMAAACSVVTDLVNAGLLRHRQDAALDNAVANATTKRIRDGWAWSRKDTDLDISPLVAATLAVHAAMSNPAAVRPTLAVAE